MQSQGPWGDGQRDQRGQYHAGILTNGTITLPAAYFLD